MEQKYINKINKLTKMFENKELSKSWYLLELAKLKEKEKKI